MGFSIYYRSTKPVTPDNSQAIRTFVAGLCKSRTWISCEPVMFHSTEDDEILSGGSKPTIEPDANDVASAATEGLPDGTVNDLLDVLAAASTEYSVDWEISHDHSPEPIGFIINGNKDPMLIDLANTFEQLNEAIAEAMGDYGFEADSTGDIESPPDRPDEPDDEPPPTLRIWTE